MIGTSSLHQLIRLADRLDWRLVLVGDPRQLQAVGRGGLFAELCRYQPHRTSWSASTASPTRGKPPRRCSCAPATPTLSTCYEEHGRIQPGPLDEHLDRIAADWLDLTRRPGGRWRSRPAATSTSTH